MKSQIAGSPDSWFLDVAAQERLLGITTTPAQEFHFKGCSKLQKEHHEYQERISILVQNFTSTKRWVTERHVRTPTSQWSAQALASWKQCGTAT